ncbi:MAG: hypothetical protein J6O50_00715 [Ruminiclostridium sp.]|nr:hypothetical protein [Ruminiclostridium sp.]
MKFKKMFAGIMSAVMLATSAFAVNAGATGGMNVDEEWLKSNKDKIVQNGEIIKVCDVIDSRYHSTTLYFHVGKTGKVELEFKVNGQFHNFGIEFRKGEISYDLYKFDTITIDGKSYKYDDFEVRNNNGLFDYYELDTQSGVRFVEGACEGEYYVYPNDGKEHTIKLTYNQIEDGYYGIYTYFSESIDSSTGEYIELSKDMTIKINFPSSSSTASTSSATAPAKTTLKASSKNGKATLKWTAADGAEKYQVAYSTDGGKTYKIYKTYKSTATKATYAMTKGNTYKFKVRSYKTVNGKKVYSKWSNVKTIKY